MGRAGTADGDRSLTPGAARSVGGERAQDLGTGENGDRTPEGKEDAVGNLLLPTHSFARDERHADSRSDQVGREKPEQHVAHA